MSQRASNFLTRHHRRGIVIALISLMVALPGCAALGLRPLVGGTTAGTETQNGEGAATLVPLPSDLAKEPTEPITTASIIAKNSSKFNGSITVPEGIIAKNSSKFRTQAYKELFLGDAYVYLTNAAGMIYIVDGQHAITKSDGSGKYDFGNLRLPAGVDVVAKALLTKSERGAARSLINYTYALPGNNRVDVSLASTVTTHFLVVETKKRNRPLTTVEAEKLLSLRNRTQALLANEDLVVSPELVEEGRGTDLAVAYRAAMSVKSPQLLASWLDLLGPDPSIPEPTPGPVVQTPGTVVKTPGI